MLGSVVLDNNNRFNKTVMGICILSMAFLTDSSVSDRQLTVKLLACAVCTTLCLWNLRVPKSTVLLFMVGYLLFVCLSSINAINRTEVLFEVCRVVMMIFVLCALSGKDFSLLIILSAMALAIYNIFDAGPWVTKTGLMGCRNPCAQALTLMLPFCVYTLKRFKWISVTAIVLVLINLYFLHNRASILAGGISLFILALMNKRYKLAIAGCIVALVFAFNSDLASLKIRLQFWSACVEIFKQNPIFGVGANNLMLEFIRWSGGFNLTPEAFTKIIVQRPHNDYLWVACETGLFGFMCYVGILVSGIYYSIKQKNRLALAGIIMYCVISFFSFPKERPLLAFMLLLYLSTLNFKAFSFRPLTAASLFLMACVTFYFYTYHDTERHIAQMRLHTRHQRWQETIDEADQCSRLNPITLDNVPVMWFKSNAHLHLREIDKAIKYNKVAYHDHRNSLYVLDRMGCFFRMFGHEKEAKMCFDKITDMVPHFETSRDRGYRN